MPLLLTSGDFQAPVVIVNLDIVPQHRWDVAMSEYKDNFAAVVELILSSSSVRSVLPIIESHLALANHWFTEEQYAEIQGISRVSGVSLPAVIIANMLYDLSSTSSKLPGESGHKACTSIVAESNNRDIVHGRNMDYDVDMVELLASLTVVVDFRRQGKTVFRSTSFMGTVGFNTVVKPGAFSITQNERDRGTLLKHLDDLIARRRIVTLSFIRQVADEAGTYDEAVHLIESTPLAASSYFIVGGAKTGEGKVVTRSADRFVDTWPLSASRGRWYLVQTNYDRSVQPPFGDDRRHVAQRSLSTRGRAAFSESPLFSLEAVLSNRRIVYGAGERPTLNSHTVYTAIMRVKLPGFIKVIVRSKQKQRRIVKAHAGGDV
eukprot:TRINITY_DN15166_c0_g1_i1.p1 TRINITY_DN15166_c0_g1~~TRINITY_DN15166_c0_g1_i1.p1  ORF type:complete len:420 (+),score=57.96 TRINITY_DN15166_c0_g1_i1:135-1262(+)